MSEGQLQAQNFPTEEQIKTDEILKYFRYSHLPEHLQPISKKFAELAEWIVTNLPRTAERTVTLRKILEAKDAGVRTRVP